MNIKKVAKISALAFVVLLFLVSIISGDSDSKKDISKTPPVEKPNAPYSKPLVISIDEVKRRFNAFADKTNFPYQLQDIEIKEGTAQNSFENHLNKILTFGADLNKDNSIKDLYAICSGDGTNGSGENAITLMVGVVAVADPSLTPAQRIDILKRLGMLDSNVKHLDAKYSSNGIAYEVSSTPEWVSFSATAR